MPTATSASRSRCASVGVHAVGTHERRNGRGRTPGDHAQPGRERGLVPAQEIVRIAVERPDVGASVGHRQRDVARRDERPHRFREQRSAMTSGVGREQQSRRVPAGLRILGGPRDALAESIGQIDDRRVGRDDQVGPVDRLPAVLGRARHRRGEKRGPQRRVRERIAAHERAAEIRARPQRRQRLRRGVIDDIERDARAAAHPLEQRPPRGGRRRVLRVHARVGDHCSARPPDRGSCIPELLADAHAFGLREHRRAQRDVG